MATSNKSEGTDNTSTTPVHPKSSWPIKKDSYELMDVIGKLYVY